MWVTLPVLLFSVVTATGTNVVIENQLSGTIQSPNFPETYPDNVNKTWIIRVVQGYRISLIFTAFDFEDSYDVDLGGACVYDYVKITDEKQERKYCGSAKRRQYDAPKIQQAIYSSGNRMTVQMMSDYSNEEPLPIGFKAHFKRVDRDECAEMHHKLATTLEDWDTLVYCNQFCHNVPGSYYCSCRVGYKLHENRHTCTADCSGEIVLGDKGVITSSAYPYSYSKLAKCDWTIQQRKGIAIDVRFVGNFSIEKHYEEGCVYDWVQYEYGGEVKSEKFCGETLPSNGQWVSTNAHQVIVTFNSDLTVEESGFQLEYKTTRVKCPYKPVAPSKGKINTTEKALYEFEDIVKFECVVGYRLIGQAQIECQDNGTWSANEPTCQIKSCEQPRHLQSLANGRIKQDTYTITYGSEVTFACYIWYEMTSGTAVWRCEDDETWHEASPAIANNPNGNAPRCDPICGLKGNKWILDGTYDFGDVIPNNETANSIAPHVFGGKLAKEGEWPWTVFVDLLGDGLLGTKFCGGSLLSEDTVVTAAHCTDITYRESIFVYTGVTNRSQPTQHMQVFSVKQMIQHEGFRNGSAFENDIAILKLNASVRIGKYARPICLPRSQREKGLPDSALQQAAGYQGSGVIAGWGLTDDTRTLPVDLMMTRIPPMNRKRCDRDSHHRVTENMLCGGKIGKRDTCEGDSGGPYMFRDEPQRRWFLNGIVSFGSADRECGDDVFGMYTKVANYIPWLEAFLVQSP